MVLALVPALRGPGDVRESRAASCARGDPRMSTLDAPPVLHPLEPLTAAEISAASAILKAEKGLGADRALRLHQPARAAQGRRPGRGAGRARGVRRPLREGRAQDLRGRRLAHRPAVVSFDAHRGRAAADHGRGVHGLRGGRADRPRLAGGDAPARGRGLLAGDGRPVGGRLHGPEDDPARAPDRAPADLGALRAGRARLRAADRRPGRDRRPRRDGGRRRRTTTASSPLPPKPGNYDLERMAAPDNVPSLPGAARRPQADLDHPARGRRASRSTGHHVAWQKWRVRVGFTPREGLVLHELVLRTGGRSSTARRWRRCSSPTAIPRRRTASRTSSTRASTASAGWPTRSRWAATASGEIFYFDGVVNDQDGEPVDDRERHLHARGGLRDRLEAHRLPHRGGRGAAAAAAGDLDASPPSATTSTGTSGTSTPTARSSTRSSSRA